MKYIFSILCFCFCYSSFSQNGDLQKQINEQVWKPFIKAFNNNDNEGFKKVHSRDVIRIIRDDNRVMGYEEYFKPVADSIKENWATWKRNIELRFIQRIASDGKAFEAGYYKTASTNTSTGETRVSYGKFHVLLRTENGQWKILMDQDAKEDANEVKFQSARPIE